VSSRTWAQAYDDCNGSGRYASDGVNPSIWGSLAQGAYVGGGKMPTRAELQAVSGSGNGGEQGLPYTAGWTSVWFWTGEAHTGGYAFVVLLDDGIGLGGRSVSDYGPVACRR
ncbi:MAG: hypothetical protein LBB60_07715, partial [Desulfovibrio sp.]|jgi:hypothetical protein|nr:hypothetical protein [Desulfovibrio sp.]